MDAQSKRDSILQQLDDIKLRVQMVANSIVFMLLASPVLHTQILESYEPYLPHSNSQDGTAFVSQTNVVVY